jgi:FAD:protein FMN transferase
VGGNTIARETVRAALAADGSRPIVLEGRQRLMGGKGAIVLVGGTAELLAECFALADRCESAWSRFLPDSDISQLNWAGGQPLAVDPLTVCLVEAMLEGADLTDGEFNPTILPDLIDAGYSASTVDASRVTVLPKGTRTAARLALTLAGGCVALPKHTALDPGGIGKGLAADLVVEFALANGAWGALAEFGGDVVADGEAPSENGWTVAVENAGEDAGSAVTMRLARGAIVTSSQVRRRWTIGEETRHHLIDSHTGRSAATTVQTATVIAATGARAEVLAKSAFLRDPAEYLAWLPTVGAAALLVCGGGEIFESDNWGIYR